MAFSMYVRMYVCMYVCMYVRMYVCMYACAMYVCMYVGREALIDTWTLKECRALVACAEIQQTQELRDRWANVCCPVLGKKILLADKSDNLIYKSDKQCLENTDQRIGGSRTRI